MRGDRHLRGLSSLAHGAALGLFATLAACSNGNSNGNDAGLAPSSSPLASTTPAPLVGDRQGAPETVIDGGVGLEFDPKTGRLIIPEEGPPTPRPLRSDSRLGPDVMPRDAQTGVVLTASFIARGVPPPPEQPEVDQASIALASKQTAFAVEITMTPIGRMKLVVQSRAMPFPYRSEIRARFDLLGHLVFWPESSRYRTVPAGALRAALGERRVDVTPVVPGQRVSAGEGKFENQPTRVVTLESALGRLRLELLNAPDAGLGATLLCRTLVELVGIDPATPECKADEIPVFSSIDWAEGGGLDLKVSAISHHTDIPAGALLVPPPGAEATLDGLPEVVDGVYLTQEELRAFRSKPIDVKAADPAAPPDGFIAENNRDSFMMLYLDGVPVVGVPAMERRYVIGPVRGRYVAQWRTFLGEHVEQPFAVELPSVLLTSQPNPDADGGT
ncbi:MAG: hypothetical protein U0271_23575 [Polyangiaceae bacterium]